MGVVAGKLATIAGGLLGLVGKGVSAAAIVTGIYYVILVALHLVTSLLLGLGGVLIKSAISWNSDIINSTFVQGGHKIILGVANMGFIVALVVIAFGTMFRSDAFGYKKALPKLIIAALLINFGYFIVTKWLVAPVDQVIVSLTDAANFNETTFKEVFDPRGTFADIPTDAYSPEISGGDDLKGQDLPWETEDNPALGERNKATFLNSVPGFVKKLGAILAGSLASIAFAFIGILALFAFAVMLFIRGIALSFLIILLPLAWIAWIFPKLKIPGGGNPWTMWWENFTRWLLFGPFAIFFLYLAVQLAKGPLPSAEGGLSTPATAVGGMIAVVGFMIGGLIVSNRMGIVGAGAALGIAAVGAAWLKVKGVRIVGRGGKALMGAGWYAEDKKRPGEKRKVQPLLMAAGKFATTGKGVKGDVKGPIVSGLTAPIRGIGRGVHKVLEKAENVVFNKYYEEEKKRTPPTIFGKEGIGGLNPDHAAARIAVGVDNETPWEINDLERELAYRWRKIRASMPTKVRLNFEGQTSTPMDAWEFMKPVYDLLESKEYQQAPDEEKGRMMAPVAAESEEKMTKRRIEWIRGKSTKGLLSANPELMEKRYDDFGNFVPFFGQNEITTDINRSSIQKARIMERPDLLTRWNAKLFPAGLVFANTRREEQIKETNKLLRRLLVLEAGEPDISDLRPHERAPKIIQKWPDQARWNQILTEIRRTSPQDAPRYEAIMEQGVETFTSKFLALLSGRGQFAQAAYDLSAILVT